MIATSPPAVAAEPQTGHALRASEAHQGTILAALHEGVVLQDAAGRIIEANPAAARLLGLTAEQLRGQTSRDPRWRAVREDGTPFAREAHPAAVALRTGRPQADMVMGVHRPDTGLIWLVVTAQPLRQPGAARPHGVVVSFADITDRKRLEEALRAGEERYRALVDHNADAVLLIAPDGQVLSANPAACRLFGRTEDELCRLGRAGLIDREDPRLPALLAERARTGHAAGELTLLRGDGSRFPGELTSTVFRTGDGSVLTSLVIRDITVRKAAEVAQREAAESFASLFAASEAITINEGGRVVAINPAYTALLGWEPEDVVGRPGTELVAPEDRATAVARAAAADERPYTVRLLRKDGTTVPVEVVGRAIRYHGRPARLATLRDVIERERAEAALRESEERFRTSFEHAAIGKALVGPDGRWLRANRALCALLGYTEAELYATTFQALTHPDDLDTDLEQVRLLLTGATERYELEKRYLHKDGHLVWGLLSVSLVRDAAGAPLHFIAQIQDIGARRELEARLAHQATHDALTGLPNRALFLNRLAHSLARRDRDQAPAVLFVDLDRFKAVNDTLGHDAGDRLLVAVAGRLRGCLRGADTAARFGGDEFAVLLDRVANPSAAVRVAERIIAAVGAPLALGAQEVVVTPSVGIALGADPADTAEDLLRFADVAMYRAKAAGPGGYEIFYPGMHADALPPLALERDLRLALERGEFVLHYQPLVALADGRMVGVEALVRWRHPVRGLLGPGGFIPLAEETGLIVPLGRWVLEEACRQARAWRDAGAPPLTMSVNVAARQLRSSALLVDVARSLAEVALPPGQLQLEITESAAMADAAMTVVMLQELKELGVRLALDDFGTGYSSLAYLKRFPVDALKVDKSFIDGLDRDPKDTALVRAIVTLAHTLGLRVIAEGIETVAQRALLEELGCDTAQGYLFARPLPAEGLGRFLGLDASPDTLAPPSAKRVSGVQPSPHEVGGCL